MDETLGTRIDAIRGGTVQGARAEAVAGFRKFGSLVLLVADGK